MAARPADRKERETEKERERDWLFLPSQCGVKGTGQSGGRLVMGG